MSYNSWQYRDDRGRFLPEFRDMVLADAKVDYEGDEMLTREVADKYEISGNTLDSWARKYGWKRRQVLEPRPDDLVRRMLALLSGQLADMEAVVKNGETEVAMLGKLVTTLDRVITLKERGGREKPRSSKRVQELRAQIAERIGELNKD